MAYNALHGITPKTVEKSVRDIIEAVKPVEEELPEGRSPLELTRKEILAYVADLQEEMLGAAARMEFERAAQLRDLIFEYRARL